MNAGSIDPQAAPAATPSAPSQAVKATEDEARPEPRQRSARLRHGVDRLELRSLPGGDRIDPEQPVVLYLGGLMAARGLEQLIDAVALVPGVQLVFLGQGAHAEPLRARVERSGLEERVHVLPPVPPGDMGSVDVRSALDDQLGRRGHPGIRHGPPIAVDAFRDRGGVERRPQHRYPLVPAVDQMTQQKH